MKILEACQGVKNWFSPFITVVLSNILYTTVPEVQREVNITHTPATFYTAGDRVKLKFS